MQDSPQQVPRLPIDLFVETDRLFHKANFDFLCALDFIGDSLKVWLPSFLSQVGGGERPKIRGRCHETAILEGSVFVDEGAEIGPFAYIQGPTYVGPGAQIRHAAFIRGNCYIGPAAVVGHTTEVKGSVFLDEAKAGHFAYVGDSLLGRDTNLGAGTKLANLKLKKDEIIVRHPVTGARIPTGMKKMGAIIGDRSSTGCNSVLSPGALLRPDGLVYPCEHYTRAK